MENQQTTKERVLQAKKEHPDWGYSKIGKLLGLDFGLVRYHLNTEYSKRAYLRKQKILKETPLKGKVFFFTKERSKEILRRRKKIFNRISTNRTSTAGDKFKIKELINQIGNEPKCYLTGRPIDLNNSASYNLDHKIPVSKGGNNSLENCGLACKRANQAKTDMTPEELFSFCKEILEYNGYVVSKNETGTSAPI